MLETRPEKFSDFKQDGWGMTCPTTKEIRVGIQYSRG
jgi:hypothetical protein